MIRRISGINAKNNRLHKISCIDLRLRTYIFFKINTKRFIFKIATHLTQVSLPLWRHEYDLFPKNRGVIIFFTLFTRGKLYAKVNIAIYTKLNLFVAFEVYGILFWSGDCRIWFPEFWRCLYIATRTEGECRLCICFWFGLLALHLYE